MVTAGSLSVSKGGIHLAKKTKKAAPQSRETAGIKSFLDMIAPSVVKFEPDHFICGNTFRCVWALREYPTQTDEQAILRHLGEKDGITLRIYTRQVTPAEEKRIIQNAANKNRMGSSNTNDLQQTITAESNLQDVASLVASMHRNREPLLHCAVYIELTASDYNTLKLLQTDVLTELVRSKLNVDRLLLRQQQGFCCASPVGYNAFGQQFERVLPASSVANLYPFNYSGKTDAKGFYVGRDKYGSNILVDFDQRDEDKTSANILILGNSGQGKSYLMKLLILNLLESGKSVITLDAEHEQQEMCEAVGGCFADLMAGKYIINVLEPKCWDDGGDPDDTAAPEAFRKSTLLAQHVSFLKDFFRAYKDFSDAHIDTIEIMVSKLYAKWGITERSNFRRMRPEDYPILSDLYDLIEEEFKSYDPNAHLLYTEKLLQEVLLGLHSMCKGADAQFFNGHTNITSSRFLVFGVKGMLSAAKNVRNAMLFNVLSFMSDMVDIYADEGITGTSVAKRDDFQRMMADCRRGLIDQILVKSISRFARNTIKNTGQLPMYFIENHHEGIVSREKYDAVQAEMARRNAAKSPSKNAVTGMASYASKYALSERLVCGECGTLYRRCTWTRNGEKRIVWRCVSRLDYGKKYCHNSPTLDEAPLQQAILAVLNTAMADKNSLIRQITAAMETELIPFPGGTMSLGDIECRLRVLEQQFQTLLEKAADDPAAYGGQFKEILDEQTFLKENRSGILADNKEQAKANQRIMDAAQTLENASPHITEWDESAVRQLVGTVKVLSKDEIAVTLKGGIEICQKIMY